MDNLDEIKKRKLEELRSGQSDQAQQEEHIQQQIQQLEGIVKPVLTKEALERYGNFKAAFPDRAAQLIVILSQAIQSGQISNIDDDALKSVLRKISPEKKDIKIRRV
jgi:programmed cell death protein 5